MNKLLHSFKNHEHDILQAIQKENVLSQKLNMLSKLYSD